MTSNEELGLKIACEIFEKKSQRLNKHRHPNIYLASNAEMFSNWFEDGLDDYIINKLGANTHPDLIINDVGFELKSLRANGQIQFNSTIPCGGFLHGNVFGECYYAIARYIPDRNYGYLEDFSIVDGDYFNHNRERAFAHQNQQETGFGDYRDGVLRHRKMYSFPSPLRQISGISFISKYNNANTYNKNLILEKSIAKQSNDGDTFTFYVYRHKLLL